MATLLGYLVLIPRITVSASEPVDSDDPFSSSITVTNTGYIPLRNVGFAVAFGEISVRSGAGIIGSDNQYSSLLIPDIGKGRDLGLDDKFQFPFNAVIDGDKESLRSANFAIVIHYEIPVIHLFREKLFPLEVREQNNGNFYWYAQPWPKKYTATGGYRISKPLYLSHKRPPPKNPN
jgi:hypothetical protein